MNRTWLGCLSYLVGEGQGQLLVGSLDHIPRQGDTEPSSRCSEVQAVTQKTTQKVKLENKEKVKNEKNEAGVERIYSRKARI